MKIELNKVYRARNGTQWKVIFIKESENLIACVNRKHDEIHFWFISGYYSRSGEANNRDLVELIGDDFIEEKKPRYFEFEGWIGESPAETTSICPYFTLNKVFGYDVSSFVDDVTFLDKHRNKTSKWRVTMQEIIE